MKARELPLSALRAFVTASRASSLAEAATELGVTHGAISKQINALEDWLGQNVFMREGRRLVLTPYGQVLADKLGQAMDEMIGACEYVRRQGNRHVVSVEAPSTLTMYWLLPLLVRFHAEHPHISVWTATRQTGQNMDLSSTDIVITRGNPLRLGTRLLETRFLFDEQLTVLSSPALLDQLPVEKPSDVIRHRLITAATRPGQWEAWLDFAGVDHQVIDEGHRFDHLFVAVHAVRDGLGSMIAPKNLFEASFAKGELAAPLPEIVLKGLPYFAHRTARSEGRHIELFSDWLQRTAA